MDWARASLWGGKALGLALALLCLTRSIEPDGPAAWEQVRARFGQASDRYEERRICRGEMLENAFDFLESAFGDSQEMVIFVTELNTNEYCVRFLQEYECERYYQYNKRLLFDDEEQRLRARI